MYAAFFELQDSKTQRCTKGFLGEALCLRVLSVRVIIYFRTQLKNCVILYRKTRSLSVHNHSKIRKRCQKFVSIGKHKDFSLAFASCRRRQFAQLKQFRNK